MNISDIPNLAGNISICSEDYTTNDVTLNNKIIVHITSRVNCQKPFKNQTQRNNVTAKRLDKLLQASNLPVVLNVSVYNKISDHLMPLMKPSSTLNNNTARTA